jgi:hypothetical protein
MLDDLDASPVERQVAARLKRGEAIVRWPELDEPEIIAVEPADGTDSGRPVSDDSVKAAMRSRRNEVHRLLPYSLCTRDVCNSGCDSHTRNDGQRLALELATDAHREWKAAAGTSKALAPIAARLGDASEGDERLAYCGAAHLAANGDAFAINRRVDIKPQLIAGIRDTVRPNA